MTFHEKLRLLLADRKQAAVARRARISPSAIAAVLARKQMPSADRVFRLARVLGVSLEWLVDDICEWPPVPSSNPEFASNGA